MKGEHRFAASFDSIVKSLGVTSTVEAGPTMVERLFALENLLIQKGIFTREELDEAAKTARLNGQEE